MVDISKLPHGPVEKSAVPGRVAGGHFASGASNIASAKDGAVGGVGADTSVSPQDRGFHYQDYAERYVEDPPAPEDNEEEPAAIDGSGLNKAPILESEGEGSGSDLLGVREAADLILRAAGSYQSASENAQSKQNGQSGKSAQSRQFSEKL